LSLLPAQSRRFGDWRLPVRLILLCLFALALAACGKGGDNPADATGIKGVHREAAGTPVPDVELGNADDEPASLADQNGKPMLVNLWATWCGPCVKELPTLQALGGRRGAPRVIAVSQDMAPRGSVDVFVDRHRLAALEVWHDPKMALSGALNAEILPTTILYDRQGNEKWRYVGDLDWTSAEAAKLLGEAR
jgi:thiol-disulfide isomerase/thioredoxin